MYQQTVEKFTELQSFDRYTPAAISIKHLLDHGKNSDTGGSFRFLKREIPTRLANMIMELQLLPTDLKTQRECTRILNDYISSFRCSKQIWQNTAKIIHPLQGDA